jgi:hypothetical protein
MNSPSTTNPHPLPLDYMPEPGGRSPALEGIIHRTTLADITGAMAQAANAIEDAINGDDPNTDAIIQAALALLDDSRVPLERKIEDCAYMRRSRQGEIDAIKREEERLAAKRRKLEGLGEYWDAYAMRCLEVAGKVKTPLAAASVATIKGARLVIDDEAALPSIRTHPLFWKRPAPTLDKAAIKAAIKDGAVVRGAHLGDTKYVRWS